MRAIPPAVRALAVDSPRKHAEGRPATQPFVVETGLRVPMADGTGLAAMLWRPKRQREYPTLVERVPYPLEHRTGGGRGVLRCTRVCGDWGQPARTRRIGWQIQRTHAGDAPG